MKNCENTFYASGSEETIEFIYRFLRKNFDVDIDCQVDELYADFNTKDEFPEDLMNKLFNSIQDKEELFMRCLSVDYSSMYHALWVCEDGWKEY